MNEEVKDNKPKKRGFFYYIKKAVTYSFLLFLSFTILLMILVNFPSFREFALKHILNIVNNELIATLEAEDMYFTAIDGIVIKNARLITAGDTLANVREVIVELDIPNLLENKVNIYSLKLKDPKIKLFRGKKDSIWNYNLIAKPSETVDTTQTDLLLNANKIEIVNGDFLFFDSTSTRQDNGTIDYTHFHLKDLNIDIDSKVNLLDNFYKATIRNITFKEYYTNAQINKLAGTVRLDTTGINISKLTGKLEQSYFLITADLQKFNLFGDTTPLIDSADLKFDLITEDFDPVLIDYFYKMPIRICKKHNLNASIDGNFSEMIVHQLNLITDDDDIYIAGKLFDITNPDKFFYDLDLSSSVVSETTLKETLCSIDLTAIPNFKKGEFKKMKVKGGSEFVDAELDLVTDIGSAKGKVELNYNTLKYTANLEYKNIDLYKFTKNNELQSNLNGNLVLNGQDFDIKKIIANLKLELHNSQFRNLFINNLRTNLNITENQNLNIDTLILSLNRTNKWTKENDPKDEYFNSSVGKINLKGKINYTNLEKPIYDLKTNLESIDLSNVLQDSKYPSHLSTEITLKGQGIDLDSLEGTYQLSVMELLFADRAVFPFEGKVEIRKNGLNRDINILSDYVNANLSGKFLLSKLLQGITDESIFLAEFIKNKINKIKPDLNVNDYDKEISAVRIKNFPEIEGIFTADIKDISIINTFLDSTDINTNMNFIIRLNSTPTTSSISIDTLDVKFLNIKTNDFSLQTNNLKLSSKLSLSAIDSTAEFKSFDLNIDECSFIIVNYTRFDEPRLNLQFDGEKMNYSGRMSMMDLYNFDAKGLVELEEGGIDLFLDSGSFVYKDSIKWEIKNQAKATSYGDNYSIENLILKRDSLETIYLNGKINNEIIDNLQLKAHNLNVADLLEIWSPNVYENLSTLILNIDTLNMVVNGNLTNPRFALDFDADTLSLNNVSIGNFNGDIDYINDNINGKITSMSKPDYENLLVDIKTFPIYLGFDTTKKLFNPNKNMDISVEMNQLAASILQPFASGISQLSGLIDANINITGFLPNKIDWNGNFDIQKASFRVDASNIAYNAEGKADFVKDKIILKNLKLTNKQEDIMFNRIGNADVTGTIGINDFKPGYIDLQIIAERLLVLSENSAASMPDLYGNFIISTDANPLRFYGTLDLPNLEGDVNVIYANIKMPLFEKQKSIRTNFTYVKTDGRYIVKIKNERDTTNTSKDSLNNQNEYEESGPSEKSIADLMNYQLRIKILGQFLVNMDMALIGEMTANIGTPDKTEPLIYQKYRHQNEANLYGEVVLKDPSIIKTLKNFNASGNISFPTGSIENPTLDLIASHSGTSYDGSKSTQYQIKMYITGTKNDPKVRFQYFIDGIEGSGSQEQINEDALYLLAVGRTKNSSNLTPSNNSLLNEGLVSGFSNFANKAISELLASTGVIQSASVDFRGGAIDFQQATVRFSGQLYGGISWTFGGSLIDISGNNEITIDIPATEFINNPFWTNFVLQLSKSSTTNAFINQDAKNWEIKVKFGNTW